MALDVREETYPSGAKFGAIYIGQTRIGAYDKRDGGFFLPWGGRKVLTSEKAAQVKVIQRYVAARLAEAAKASALLKECEIGDRVK